MGAEIICVEGVFDYLSKYDYENVFLCQDRAVGLKAVIAIHDTTLGPATGGCRMWTYNSDWEAIEDALRLARGMTYKYAAAGVNLGGGKTVVIGDPRRRDREALFRTLGRFINRLGGKYYTGEDVGTTLEDMEYIYMETEYVVTLPTYLGGAGPISPMTAFGVIQAMRACCREVYGDDGLREKRVAVQGLGAVGYELAKQLVEMGAKVWGTDIDEEKLERVRREFGVKGVNPTGIYAVECEIFAPCALGGIINDETIPRLTCKIICGSANNQLGEEKHGDLLTERGILYGPDYIVNAGGTIYDTERLGVKGVSHERGRAKVARIYQTMQKVIEISKRDSIPTYSAADRMAEERIRAISEVRKYADDLKP
jgi:leucine dehydrogenase